MWSGGVWFVVAKRASGSKGLSLVCGLSWRKGRVGQEACRWSVVCRREKGEWVKEIVAGVWSVGAKRASGSKKLSAECGLSWRKRCVGQGVCRRCVVCRGEKGEWVKRPVAGVWSVGVKTLRGSKKASGVVWSVGRKRCVGQRNCRWRVVCRGENAAWVKRPVGGVWSGGRNRCVGQENCRCSVVCRGEKGE